MSCMLIQLDVYRRLRHLRPEDFARRVRLMAHAAGCTLDVAQYVGEQARIAAIAGVDSRWDIITKSRALALALARDDSRAAPAGQIWPSQ